MAPWPGMMSHLPSLKQKSVWTLHTLWHGRPSTLRYPASHTHSASPDHRLTMHLENSLQAWNLHGSARSPVHRTTAEEEVDDSDKDQRGGGESMTQELLRVCLGNWAHLLKYWSKVFSSHFIFLSESFSDFNSKVRCVQVSEELNLHPAGLNMIYLILG